jgi:nicotinate phosphoribosyltransferase
LEGLLISDYSDHSSDIALSTDFYEITMAAAYYYYNSLNQNSKETKNAIFEMFVRKPPLNRSYIVVAGLEQVIYFLMNMKFNDKHISYLQSLEVFKKVGEDFFEYLKRFRFTGTVWSVPEGTVLFPNEPILRIEAPIIEGQIIETYLLSTINFQSLIATKASRIVTAAEGKSSIVEFGSRRAHGPQAGLLAARASYIGGCTGTSNTLAGYKLGIPVFGTMAHSYIMSFEKEEEAFKQFSHLFPSGFLLVDTYDSIEAIKKIIKSGIDVKGIRLDSGDLYYLSVESRKLLDNAGYKHVKIMVSGDLNEYSIQDLVKKGAPIDSFGVGTELSTSRDDPAMNGVYKLVALRVNKKQEDDDHDNSEFQESDQTMLLYKLKTSPGKRTYPGPKQIQRIIENKSISRDLIILEDEETSSSLGIPLLRKIFDNGHLLYEMPPIEEIQQYCLEQIELLPTQFKDLAYVPREYPVTYSDKLKSITREFYPN